MLNKTHYCIEVAESVKKYIECNVERNINLDDAAKAANYSLKQLNRIFSMATGLTLGEYVRSYKLIQALFELKYSAMPIIDIAFKYGYESQEAFTRAFKDVFSVTPGDYRKRKSEIVGKNGHIRKFIHDKEHEYYYRKGIYSRENIESWIITKPNRIWASARRNTENFSVGKFYAACNHENAMQKAAAISDAIMIGGAYLPTEIFNREKYQSYLQAKIDDNKSNGWKWFRKWELSFGVELEENYPLDSLQDFEILHIPSSQYMVFHHAKYGSACIELAEKQDSVMKSAWNAQKDYDIATDGLKWAFDTIPYFEEDSKETGYTLWFPVCEENNSGS
jgi:AraC-like DNA-binding protein